jgi:hypothetical protein
MLWPFGEGGVLVLQSCNYKIYSLNDDLLRRGKDLRQQRRLALFPRIKSRVRSKRLSASNLKTAYLAVV